MTLFTKNLRYQLLKNTFLQGGDVTPRPSGNKGPKGFYACDYMCIIVNEGDQFLLLYGLTPCKAQVRCLVKKVTAALISPMDTTSFVLRCKSMHNAEYQAKIMKIPMECYEASTTKSRLV